MMSENQTIENQNAENQSENTEKQAETQHIEINLDELDGASIPQKAMMLIELGKQLLQNQPQSSEKKRKVVIDLNARITIK